MRIIVLCLFLAGLAAGQKYKGPRPEKPDVPYLLHAQNLIATDAAEAREDKRKEGKAYVTSGASAKAKTPLAEPIFLFESKSIPPEKLTLYKLDVKNAPERSSSSTIPRSARIPPKRSAFLRKSLIPDCTGWNRPSRSTMGNTR